MILIPLTLAILKLISATDSVQETGLHNKKNHDAHTVFKSYMTPLIKTPYNSSASFLMDNELKVPMRMEFKSIKKMVKKSPKRTIQRIIKKSKFKARRMFSSQVTKAPTQPSPNYDNMAGEDKSRQETPTTEPTLKKKIKLWNAKRIRYPMPFQKFNSRHETIMHHRIRRDTDRDLYILQDLDEMEFLSDKDGNNVVKAHIKKYW